MKNLIEKLELNESSVADVNRDVHSISKDTLQLRRDTGAMLKKLKSVVSGLEDADPGYAKELQAKLKTLTKGAEALSDFDEMIGTLKLRKGAW